VRWLEKWLPWGAAGEENRHKRPTFLEGRMFMAFRKVIYMDVEWKWGTFVQRQLLVNRAPVLTLWAVVGEVLGGQRTAPEDAQGRKSDR
jgi:hypothetical protein